MTTPPIQTLTDELLVEIEYSAKEAKIARSGNPWFSPEDCCWWTGNADEGDFMAAVDPATVSSLITELRTLRAQVKALQSEANSWQSGYDEGRRMAGKHRLSEIEQLRAENASMADRIEELSTPYSRTCERMWALEAENAELRKDAAIARDHLLNARHDVEYRSQYGSEAARLVLAGIDQYLSDTAMEQAK